MIKFRVASLDLVICSYVMFTPLHSGKYIRPSITRLIELSKISYLW